MVTLHVGAGLQKSTALEVEVTEIPANTGTGGFSLTGIAFVVGTKGRLRAGPANQRL